MVSLQHPHVLPVYDWGRLSGRDHFMVSKLCEQVLKQFMSSPAYDIWRACEFIAQTAEALDYVHQHGIIHRDVKPANILINKNIAFISDFGLAISVKDDRTGFAGTPGYMSPEQIKGGWFDGRSDIYSLGISLYQMITGSLPFRGPLEEVLASIQSVNLLPPSSILPEIPTKLDEIVLKSTDKNPLARYQTASQLASELRSLLHAQESSFLDTNQYVRPPDSDSAYDNLDRSRVESARAYARGSPIDLARSLEETAAFFYSLQNYKSAIIYWMKSLSEYRRAEDSLGVAHTSIQISQSLSQLGERGRALEFARSALKLYDSLSHPEAGSLRKNIERMEGETHK